MADKLLRSPAPLWLLIAMSMVQPVALNMYVPAMAQMQADLGTTRAAISLSLSAFLIATALATLVVGAISDMRGRRPVLIFGLGLYAIGSVLCALAPSVEMLIAGRVVQAIGSCAGLALSRAIVRDLHGARTAASALAYVTMGMAVAPMIAPSLGGLMSEHLGWRPIFVFMAVIGVVITIATFVRLGETHPPSGEAGGVARMRREALELFGVRTFWMYVATVSFISTSFFSFVAGSAFISETVLNLAPSVYGLFFMCVAAGYITGNFITGRFVERIGIVMMIRFGTMSVLSGISLAAIAQASGVTSSLTFFAPMALVGLGNGLTLPNAIAGAVSVRPHLAGTASGLTGAMQLGAGAVAATVTGILVDVNPWPGTVWPVLGPMACGTAVAFLFALNLKRGAVQ
ncbi:multidrug effflux MFS transporter [Acuticoccus sp. I52.16.1]|uniref:multidrug effflux MFS transporter n=1 Tax=Acuticoccus sp. I52.16.1 TaxID=2928472 RepID=UPI001FCFEBE4|nr:multidrug effflux MFS transporter [Acuticoccus sp. I52.16.1]UOM33257.1 multidrug effflux MFS transporter [Acuticoccus sp. I52.16.1]